MKRRCLVLLALWLVTDLIIAPGLLLITRFDAMERAWGASRSVPSNVPDSINGYFPVSAGTRAESENIAFDYVYLPIRR